MKKTGVKVGGKSLYVHPTTRYGRIGSRGRAETLPIIYALVGRGVARRVRKALRAEGFRDLAALPRHVV